MIKLYTLALLFLLTLPASAWAEESAELLFRQGKWQESVAAFKKAMGNDLDNASPGALYNLGTALAKSGANAEAYAILLKAHYRQPLDGDINHNLSLLEKKIAPTAVSVRPYTWFTWWPEFLRAMPLSVFLLLSLAALAPALWIIGSKSKSPIFAPCLFLFTLFLFMSLLGQWQGRYPVLALTVTSKLRSGPETSFQEITTLEAGSLVNLEETRDLWHKVRFQTPNSQETVGWIESSTALRVLP